MLSFEHICGDSKLKCIDCERQICPKCMVQCPVGNRCPNCTKRFTSHVLQINPTSVIRGLIAAIFVGLLFSLMESFLPLGGFYQLLLDYFLGVLAGNIVFKTAGRKIGTKMAITAIIGAFLGNLCFVWLGPSLSSKIIESTEAVKLIPPSLISFPFIIFLIGLVSPFLGWNFSWPFFRR